jgi:hypothetical protein
MNRNLIKAIFSIVTLVLLYPSPVFSKTATEREDWSEYFDEANAKGTIVVSDERQAARRQWHSMPVVDGNGIPLLQRLRFPMHFLH